MSDYKLSHLQELEAESIHIIREVAAEFENPVMLYSIGKDSSVMVRLAEKAFSPGKVPFPLMHIDSKLFVTDEIFGLCVSVPEKLNPAYMYGMVLVASPAWVLGTYFGVLFGNILPASIVSALSVGLYGMFIAIIIPPARKNKIVACVVAISMIISCIFSYAPIVSSISSGTRIIILTVVISLAAAVLFPVKENEC